MMRTGDFSCKGLTSYPIRIWDLDDTCISNLLTLCDAAAFTLENSPRTLRRELTDLLSTCISTHTFSESEGNVETVFTVSSVSGLKALANLFRLVRHWESTSNKVLASCLCPWVQIYPICYITSKKSVCVRPLFRSRFDSLF